MLKQADIAELREKHSSRSKNLFDCKDSEPPLVDDDITADFKALSSPMDTMIKLQLLLKEQSLIRDVTSFFNSGLQTLKDSSPPQDCNEPDFSANLAKSSKLSVTDATHSMCSDSFESSSLSALEELFNFVFKEQNATTNTNNKLHFGVDAPMFSDSMSSEEDSEYISELLKNEDSKRTWQTNSKRNIRINRGIVIVLLG